jgi:hypothetical protein
MVGQEPPKETLDRIREAKKHPIVYDEDCPELTDEELAEFHPVNGMTWAERAQSMRSKQSEIRREIHYLIEEIPDSSLSALKPLLELLADEER